MDAEAPGRPGHRNQEPRNRNREPRNRRAADSPDPAGAGRPDDAERRGRFADGPTGISLRGWRDILLRVKSELAEDHLDVVAAGVAFYAMLALFPGMAALVSIYGLIADPADVQAHLAMLGGIVPAQSWDILNEQLKALTSADKGGLTLAALFSLLLLIWSASKGTKSAMAALNIVYDEREERGFVLVNAIGLGLALGAVVMVVLWVALIAVLPIAFDYLGIGETLKSVFDFLRWPLLAVLFAVSLAALYRLGPDRRSPRWRWVSVGALISVALWIAVSLGFSWYVSSFGSYGETYGSIGAIVVLMLWLYLSAYIVLLGAELNSEIEHQTAVDTTVGRPKPLGERGAVVADTIGERPPPLF